MELLSFSAIFDQFNHKHNQESTILPWFAGKIPDYIHVELRNRELAALINFKITHGILNPFTTCNSSNLTKNPNL